MQTITDFADLAVVLPLAACVTVWLALSGWRRGAALWVTMFAALLALMLALKLIFLGCAPAGSPISSPSGHTASATYVFGGVVVFMLRGHKAWAFAAAIVFAALFGVSRVALHAHSLPEVFLGAGAGLGALALFALLAGPTPSGLPPSPGRPPAGPGAAWRPPKPGTAGPWRRALVWPGRLPTHHLKSYACKIVAAG
jgi:membrane-associated phospholipid phosphatase